ncbi:hypothetical protein FRC00_009394, partial [Tulasnella sp. 408]
WRHILDDDDYLEEFRTNHDGIMALSGHDVQNVRLLEVETGSIIWETQLQALDLERLPEFRCIGACIVFASDETADLFVSSNTGSIHRLNGLTGGTKWTWTPVDNAPLTPLSKMIAAPTTVYLVHFVKSTNSYKVHVTAIDSDSGEQIFTRALPADILNPTSDAIFVGNPRLGEATLVWAQPDGAKFLRLSTLKETRTPQPLVKHQKVVDVRLGAYGLFIALKADGSSSVMRVDPEGPQWIKVDWEFSDSASAPPKSTPIFTGGFDKQGRPYVSRTFWSAHSKVSTLVLGYLLVRVLTSTPKASRMELYVPHQNFINGFFYSFDTIQNGRMFHTAMDVASTGDKYFPRFAITTSTGSFQMWQGDRKLWLREEALAHIASATYVKLPHLAGQNTVVSNPVARFSSQLGELARAPVSAIVGLSNIIRSIYPPSAPGNSTTLDERFGFRHLIVVSTMFGKVLALDSTTGDVVWGQILGKRLNSGMQHFATTTETGGITSELFLIASSQADGGSSLVYHFHPLSGASLGSVQSREFAEPQYQFAETVVDAAVVENRLIMIDGHHNIHTYPKAASQQKLESASHMTSIYGSRYPPHVAGYRLSESGRPGSSSQLSARQTWSMSFGDESIHWFIKPTVSPTAAGNNTAASNPSNRNFVGIVSSTQGSTELVNCVVRIVDGTKGTLVYRAELGSGRCEDVRGIFIEDMFVYSHQDTVASGDSAKGFRITAVDLKTGPSANPQVQIQQRTFAVGFQPKYLASTFTKYGIALQDLIVATDKDQIISLPNRLLHTLGAAPQSAQGSSAAIPPSANVVQDEPRITISQNWQ